MRREIHVSLFVFVTTATIYLMTSAPGLGLIDCGELTTVACTLGIAHPTGYPLYTILARVWLVLAAMSPDRAMVIFSVLCGALACGVLTLAAYKMLDTFVPQSPQLFRILLPAGMAIGFAISPTAWTSILFAEVYPLTWLIAAILLWLTVLILAPSSATSTSAGLLFLLFYLWGLGLGNHLTIIWYSPIMLVVLWRFLRNAEHPFQVIAACVAFVLLGATTLLYLPVRSSLNPALDWGNPESLSNFIRHLSAWQYQVWMFKGNMSDVIGKFFAFLIRIPDDIGWMMTFLAAAGLWLTLRRRVLIGYLMLAVWLIGTIYNMNYDIPDISSYFLVFYCPLFLLAVLGLQFAFSYLGKVKWNRVWKSGMIVLLAIFVPITSALASRHIHMASNNDFTRRFTREVIATLPDSALVFHGDWDVQSPFLYYQQVENLRPDIVMLDLGLMQRSWYIEQERRNHPDVFAGSERQADAFLQAVAPFEAGKVFDGQRLEAIFVDLHNSIIREQLPHRPVYIRDVEDVRHPGIGAPFPKIPGGYFVRIGAEDTIQEPFLRAEDIINGSHTFSEREHRLLSSAAQSALMQAQYARLMGDTMRFMEALNTAMVISGDDPRVQAYVQHLRTDTETRQP